MNTHFYPQTRFGLRAHARRWLVAAALLGAGWCQAQAANVLMLTTNPENVDEAPTTFIALAKEFQVPAKQIRPVLSNAGSVTNATFSNADNGGKPYDLVIIGAEYNAMDTSNMQAIADAMQQRRAAAFMLLIDGCCDADTHNLSNWLPRLQTMTGWSGLTVISSDPDGPSRYPLNPDALGKASWSQLPVLYGGAAGYIGNVPQANALYLPRLQDAAKAAGAAGTAAAYALWVPNAQSYGGQGACMLQINDMSGFVSPSYDQNKGLISTAMAQMVQGCAAPNVLPPGNGNGGAAQATPVPGLGWAGLVALSALMAAAGALHARRRTAASAHH